MRIRRLVFGLGLGLVFGLGLGLAGVAAAAAAAAAGVPASDNAGSVIPHATASSLSRERSSLNAGWRFHLGDPAGASDALRYDVRPIVTASSDGKAADARPDAAEKIGKLQGPLLKPWILPTANPFILDPARRHTRPAREPRLAPRDTAFLAANFDDSAWQRVHLPHDWAIAGPFLETGPSGGVGRLASWGIGWYRKQLAIPRADQGRRIFLDLDGAMSYATVWLNGHLVGGWPYGYNSWRVDLTPFVVPGGTNTLAIRLDNPAESSRWYPGGGIYRNVWLTKTDPVHIAQWGTRVTTPKVAADAADVALEVSIDNDSKRPATIDVDTAIYALDAAGTPTGPMIASIAQARVSLAAGANGKASGAVTIAHPALWGPPPQQRPNRYVAVTILKRDGVEIDRYQTPFGIRTLRFDPTQGVFVNGQHVELKGVNNHHDLGALGAAFNVRAAERQLEMMQEMGANALRMSHNPPAPELLELTDRMGILVIDEIFDVWERKKTALDSHLLFPDWHEPDLRAMLRRDRHHPSVVIWSVGNEVGEQYSGEEGAAIARTLVAIVRQEDPDRPTMTAMNFAKPDMPLPGAVDLISLNYQGAGIRSTPGNFDQFHARYPDKVIFSSESASALSSRGEYQFPLTGGDSAPVRPGAGGDFATHHVNAYELFAADFGTSADRSWAAQDQHPFVAGEFVWTGWDYLGEPTPFYTSRSSYSGIIDLAGFKKDRFYLYQARWRPDLPIAHILPHWSWPGREGQVTPVHVFTSGDEAELFVNGKSQGRRKRGKYEYRLRWDYVTYEPGELKVVAWKDGKPTPAANNQIRFTIDGPGEIVATDNGDPTSFVAFPSPERPAFNGLCLLIVRAKPGQTGAITVRASSPSLGGAVLTLQSIATSNTKEH